MPTTCPECGKECKSGKGLKMHFTGQHEDKKRGNQFPWEAKGDVECPTCGRLCANEAGMRRHHKWEQGESLARVERTCRECGETVEMYESELEALEHDDLCVDCSRGREIPHDEETARAISEAQKGKVVPREVLEKCWAGRDAYLEKHDGHADEIIEEIGKASRERELSDEARQKISETLQGHEVSEETRQKLREKCEPHGGLSLEVPETGHTVRSHWEKEVDLLLHQHVETHEYEPEAFDIGWAHYTPDFRIDDVVIEVKGWARDRCKRRAKSFMDEFPEYTYIVVGSETPCDVHIPWDEREQLRSLV